MKSLFTLIIFSLSFQAMAKILPGECRAEVYSKKYLKDKDSDQTQDQKLHFEYTCDYTCLDLDKNKHTVNAYHSVHVRSDRETARRVVCHGVKMKEYDLENTTYYEFSHVAKFYSRTSRLKEIKAWANQFNIPYFSYRNNRKINSLKKTLRELQASYKLTLAGLQKSNPRIDKLFSAVIVYTDQYIEMPNDKLYQELKRFKNMSKKKKQREFIKAQNPEALKIVVEGLLSLSYRFTF